MKATAKKQKSKSWGLGIPVVHGEEDVKSYPDPQRYRLGANYQQLPVNQPKCPVMHYQRDGAMAPGNNGGSGPNYEPNSHEDAPKQNSVYADPAWDLGNVKVDRYDRRKGKKL